MTRESFACAARKARPLQGAGLTLALCAALLTARAFPADDVPPGQAAVVGLDGQEVTGPLLAVSTEQVRLGPTASRRDVFEIATSEILSIDLSSRGTLPTPTSVLEFANGDRLAVDVGRSEGDVLAARSDGAALRVPLETLRGIVLQPSDSGDAALLLRKAGENDLVLLTNGDRFAGQLLGLSESDLTLDADGREIRIPRERIATIAFSPELTSARRVDGKRQIVHTDAGWLTVAGLTRTDDGSWQAETPFGEKIAWPSDAVRRIQFAGDRAVFLSDLEPENIEFVPYFDRVWPMRADRGVTGDPLSAHGTIYAKGLGVHSRCRITYHLGGKYQTFHAVAAMAKSAGEIGSAEFAVEVDGREVIRTAAMTRSDAPLRITKLDVEGATTLVLTVDFGRNGDVRDRANWCDAILVK
ncbi:MAG: NPCBM/NEW2 domain-containing protein [Planctomycetaceae bacterium]